MAKRGYCDGVTGLALSKVTDEFISYIRAMGDNWDLDEVSEFLVVAATLLDLKAAKLLPQAEVEDGGLAASRATAMTILPTPRRDQIFS